MPQTRARRPLSALLSRLDPRDFLLALWVRRTLRANAREDSLWYMPAYINEPASESIRVGLELTAAAIGRDRA
jgi:hypothetical protein